MQAVYYNGQHDCLHSTDIQKIHVKTSRKPESLIAMYDLTAHTCSVQIMNCSSIEIHHDSQIICFNCYISMLFPGKLNQTMPQSSQTSEQPQERLWQQS